MVTDSHRRYALIGLRWSLALVFFWFGILKAFGHDPVYEIINATFPILATPTGNLFLGIGEALLGLFLAINAYPRLVSLVLVLHLVGTMSTLVIAPSMMFQPHFPILTLAGEFVIKNIVLIMAAIALLLHGDRK